MLLFIGLPVFTVIVMCIIHASYGIENLRLHWNEYRCNPMYMPFASYIRPDVSVEANFNYCMNMFGTSIFSTMIDGINSLFKELLSSLTELTTPLVGFRKIFSNMQKFILSFATQVFGKIANSMSTVVYILVKIRDIMKRFIAEGYISSFLAVTGIDFIVSFVTLVINIVKIFIYIMLAISFFLALFNLPLLVFVLILASLIAASGF